MNQYKMEYSVNGIHTCEILSARTPTEAKKLVEAKYPGARITWWSYKRV